MANFNPKNFGRQNTPAIVQKIGDVALIIGAAGLAILGLPAMLPAATIAAIPSVVFTIGGYATAVGVFGKLFTKFFGKSEDTPTQ